MFWMYFAHEFYHPKAAPASAAASPTVTAPVTAPVATSNPTPSPHDPASLAQVAVGDEIPTIEHLLRRVNELEAALAVSDRGRDAFLSSMSHELRTPLNAIMGFSEMISKGVFGAIENPTYQEYAGHIHASGSSLLGKINDLLDIASLDAGGILVEEEDFCLADLLAEAVEIHSHKAFEREQHLRIDCAETIRLWADRRKLLCALTHFLSNALRHSATGAEILLMVRIQPDDGVIMSVRDAGDGIPTAQLEVIRHALQQESSYRNIEPGGIGLGLALSRELAAQHQGRLMIDSIRHRGTVVSMILPKERILAGMPAKRRRGLELV